MSTKKPAPARASLYARRFIDTTDRIHHIAIWFDCEDTTSGYIIKEMRLAAKPEELHAGLLNQGAAIPIDRKPGVQAVQDAVMAMSKRNGPPGTLYRRTGWHDTVFVRPDAPPTSRPTPILVPPEVAKLSTEIHASRGTLGAWKKSVAKLAKRSSYVAFTVAHALSAPLSRRIEEVPEGVIFNLVGASSTGKTKALGAAISTYGPPDNAQGWSTTPRALVERANLMSDMPLILDDMQNMPASGPRSSRIREAAHALAGGTSIAYAKVVQAQLPTLEFWCWALSTNTKRTADEYSTAEAGERDLSERVRLIDIPILTSDEGGIWDRRDETESREPAELSEALGDACRRAYGVVMKRWLDLIEEDGDKLIDRLRAKAKWFLEKLGALDGADRRVGWKFAAVYAAGLIATEAKLLPWSKRFLREVVTTIWERSRTAASTDEERKSLLIDSIKAIEAIATPDKCVEVKGKVRPRFPRSASPDCFIRTDPVEQTHFLRRKAIEGRIGAGRTAAVLQILDQKGIMKSKAQHRLYVGKRETRPWFIELDFGELRHLREDMAATGKA